MKSRSASFLLLLTAIIWGCSFVAQDVSSGLIGPFTFNFARFYIGALVLVPFVIHNAKKEKPSKAQWKLTIKGGIFCGLAIAVASVLQQAGVESAGAGKAGFITSLYNIFVPIMLLMMGRKVDKKIWLYAAIAVFGMYLLCIKEGFQIAVGDYLLLGCAIGFSLHILVIDHFNTKCDGVTLSMLQFLTAGVVCTLGALLTETIDLQMLIKAAIPILYAGVFSCGVAYTLQVVAQKYVHPTAATLILSLESVVAALAGWLILGNGMTTRELIGCAVVFLAVLLAQLQPSST